MDHIGFKPTTVEAPLVGLRGDGPIRIGASTAVAHATSHAASRALSATVHDALLDADGFLYSLMFTGACRREDMAARDDVESDYLDLDRLSVPREA